MKKLLMTASLLTLSGLACAQEYTIDVNLQVEEIQLGYEETQLLKFPPLTVNRATDVGAICNAHYLQPNVITTPEQSLCFRATEGQSALFTLQGVPYADITWHASAPEQIVDGLSFVIHDSALRNGKLNNEGELVVNFLGQIRLTDKDAALQGAGAKQFTYDFVAAYQ
ncbi:MULTISPECIES: hypothetical protein [Pseudoalteromonas]|uniref:DUF4402 domain-containing protein n=1 Tax=Pseudoalteromonas amylolytica TaxID=1859457 RepID=A0A1S1MSI0_9GAMM|nr:MULTISPECIES: hypothetical protein [Pseudoalteromonas]MCF6435627.1 hypothetical protein [Pseudoalteromonas sp. MMG022]OHU86209.1 hypothetical protein BFC16_16020 [Pseudoalteromonas sp. JW3]OHU89685.1 hypothetical protein BET10_16300 [Pseudoalteromonas amylolytica]